MKNSMLRYVGLSLCVVCSPLVMANMPGFDIWLGELQVKQGLLQVSELKPLTHRTQYDNQPLFLPDGQRLLYTAAIEQDGIEQTDSFMLQLADNSKQNLTASAVSEYSPTLMPDGHGFSVIRAADEQQKLWRYPLQPLAQNAEPPTELLKHVNPVGYHAWVDTKQVLLFVLGEPHTLQLADIVQQTSQVVDSDIGASLYKIPGSELMSYTAAIAASSSDEPIWQLKSFNPDTAEIKVLTQLPSSAYYYAWSADGKAIAAQGSSVLQWDSKHPTDSWQVFADVSEQCPQGVSRIAVNAQNTKIALVCALSH